MFLFFMTPAGVSATTTAYFADEDACKAAIKQMAPELNQLRSAQNFYMHCQPMTSDGGGGVNSQPRPQGLSPKKRDDQTANRTKGHR